MQKVERRLEGHSKTRKKITDKGIKVRKGG